MTYNMFNLKIIWPLFLEVLWIRIKLPIWFLTFILTIILSSQLQMENVNSILISSFQNTIHYLHFHLKHSKIHKTSTLKVKKTTWNVGTHSPTPMECAWVMGHNPKPFHPLALTLVMSSKLWSCQNQLKKLEPKQNYVPQLTFFF